MKFNTTLHELIIKRRSTVLFSEKGINIDVIKSLFEAARWAPSSNNQQPWRFIYALKGEAFYSILLSCLNTGNQVWARNAPVLVCTVAQVISDYKDRENKYAWHDTAMAFTNLTFQATHMGLSVHPMGGYSREKTIELLGIPERYEPVIFAAIGYKASSLDFPEDLVDRENKKRSRKELREFLFHGRFNNKTNE